MYREYLTKSFAVSLQAYGILVRDIYAFFPLLIKYVDLHRSHWLKHPTMDAEELFSCVAELFGLWSKSLVNMTNRREQIKLNVFLKNFIKKERSLLPYDCVKLRITNALVIKEAQGGNSYLTQRYLYISHQVFTHICRCSKEKNRTLY